jgi:hypothetical protein
LCNQLLGKDVPPNHRLVVPNINNKSPPVGARNPQEKGASHSPLTTQKSHNPLVFSYNYPEFPPTLFLLTCPTQGMYPFTALSPLGVPFIYQGLSGTCNQESLCWELKGTHCQEKLPGKQQQTIVVIVQLTQSSLFRPDNLALQYSAPKCSKNAPTCSKIHPSFLV